MKGLKELKRAGKGGWIIVWIMLHFSTILTSRRFSVVDFMKSSTLVFFKNSSLASYISMISSKASQYVLALSKAFSVISLICDE